MVTFRMLLLLLAFSVLAGDTTSNVNYANGHRALPVWADGQLFSWGNFSQLQPHTVVGGDAFVEFIKCNMHNCDAGPNTTFTNCYQVGNHTSYCFWLHPEWPLDSEVEVCSHTDSLTLMMDGADTVAVEYYRSDKAVQ